MNIIKWMRGRAHLTGSVAALGITLAAIMTAAAPVAFMTPYEAAGQAARCMWHADYRAAAMDGYQAHQQMILVTGSVPYTRVNADVELGAICAMTGQHHLLVPGKSYTALAESRMRPGLYLVELEDDAGQVFALVTPGNARFEPLPPS